MSKGKGRPQRAAVAIRRKRELELLNQGVPASQLPSLLNVSRITIWRDLCAIDDACSTTLPEDFRELKRKELKKFQEIVASSPRMSEGRKVELGLAIWDRSVKIGPELSLNDGADNVTNITVSFADPRPTTAPVPLPPQVLDPVPEVEARRDPFEHPVIEAAPEPKALTDGSDTTKDGGE